MPNFYMQIAYNEGVDRAVTDYISGMSDEFATRLFEELFVPQKVARFCNRCAVSGPAHARPLHRLADAALRENRGPGMPGPYNLARRCPRQPMIPQEYIQEVVRRNDIEEIIGQYVQLRRRGRTAHRTVPLP